MSTATSDRAPIIGHPPEIPDTEWISLAPIANTFGGHPEYYERQAEKLGIELESRGRGWPYVRARDLDAFIGPDKARSFRRSAGPEWVRATIAAGLVGVADNEVIALAERRGVTVNRSFGAPMISRGGAIVLARILDREQSYPVDDGDWIRADVALPFIRKAQGTLVSGWGQDDIDLTDPDEPRFSDETARELACRCRWMGIRYRRPKLDRFRRGALAVCGFDLFRLLDISSLPGQDLDAYRAAMAAAYEGVMGKPLPASDSSTTVA